MSGINLYAENIAANISIPSQTQGFTFTTPISQYQLINDFTPTSLTPSQNALELINVNDAGYRWRQLTSNTATLGNLILENFTSGSIPGTAILTFNENGNTVFNTAASTYKVSINNTNVSATAIEFDISQSGTNQIGFGYNPISSYGYVWAYTNIPIQFGVNNVEILYINSSGLNLNGNAIANAISITAGNLELISNTLQSNNTNGNILIAPNGSGNVAIGSGTPSYLLDVNGTMRAKKLLGNNNKPTVVPGSAAGSSPSSTITGSELGGTFLVTTGSGATTGLIGTFTLAVAMPSSTFSVVFTPANSTTGGISKWEGATSSSTFTLNAITALSASTTYLWNYQIIGY
jgi:hypothetical protein